MHIAKRTIVTLAALLFVLGTVPAFAQDPPGQSAPAQTPSMAQGQLVRVDTAAKTIEIRSAQNAVMTFSYNEDTKVSGADESVAGLATKAGTELSIRYTKQGQVNLATQIDVRAEAPKKP